MSNNVHTVNSKSCRYSIISDIQIDKFRRREGEDFFTLKYICYQIILNFSSQKSNVRKFQIKLLRSSVYCEFQLNQAHIFHKNFFDSK